MAATLEFRGRDHIEQLIQLSPEKCLTLGRHSDCDVVIDDPYCSRYQAELFQRDSRWIVKNSDARNPTIVSGQSIDEERILRDGDVLTFGKTELLFRHQDIASEIPSPVSELGYGSITAWLQELRSEDSERIAAARNALWGLFYERLSALARRRAGKIPQRVADDEDIVLSAFHSFFKAVDNQNFPKLDDRSDLWRILATIAARKVCRQIERQTAQKRGGGNVAGESVFALAGSDSSPGIDQAAQDATDDILLADLNETWQTYIRILPDATLQQIAEARLMGYTNKEIAGQLKSSERTVERKLQKIRELWEQFCDG